MITSQLKAAMIFSKDIKGKNYNIDTINGKIYIFGISMSQDEKRKVIELNKNNATRVYEFMTSKEFAQWARDQINFLKMPILIGYYNKFTVF